MRTLSHNMECLHLTGVKHGWDTFACPQLVIHMCQYFWKSVHAGSHANFRGIEESCPPLGDVCFLQGARKDRFSCACILLLISDYPGPAHSKHIHFSILYSVLAGSDGPQSNVQLERVADEDVAKQSVVYNPNHALSIAQQRQRLPIFKVCAFQYCAFHDVH